MAGEAKRRGSYEQRKEVAIAAGRIKKKPLRELAGPTKFSLPELFRLSQKSVLMEAI
jgi:hypothetical protein